MADRFSDNTASRDGAIPNFIAIFERRKNNAASETHDQT